MNSDFEQFYEVFFEESSELLAEMEACLLGLDVNSPDTEDLNAIFRAAHSIKGGAGTFGFTDMTEMTHMLETLLDKLRKGEIEIRSEMIDTFLKAGDVIKSQLAAHKGDGQADEALAAEVSKELKQYEENIEAETPNLSSSVAQNSSAAAEDEQTANFPAEPDVSDTEIKNELVTFHIEFSSEGVNQKSMNHLCASLNHMGELVKFSESDQQQCRFKLTTATCEDDIWETLAFVVDPSQLKIDRQEEKNTHAKVAAPEQLQGACNNSVDSSDPEACINEPYGFFPGAPAAPDEQEQSARNKSESQHTPEKASSAELKRQHPAQSQSRSNAGSGESSSIRVSVEKVDQMINLVGELVITQAMLTQTASEVDPELYERLNNGLGQLERNTRDLQEAVMSIRMLPISFVFSRYPRVVRDVAAKLKKKVELKTVGEGTELDKGLIEKIADPLTHLVRNSLDHGIELPEKRVAEGKSETGTITLRAFHQGGSIVIEVGDDGAGLNRDKILAKAMERGLSVNDGMSDQEVWMLIFEPGFSTADEVTDVSGRGVGMDVVKRNIQDMGGRVEIDSVCGIGTRITIRLPLTLAILDGLSVTVGDQMFIVPLTYIAESLQIQSSEVKTVGGIGRAIHVRGEYLPIIELYQIFNIKPHCMEIGDGILVILDAEGQKAALFVDALVGQHQVVIKSLESNYRRVKGVSGATIMGDGKVALILDTAGLVTASHKT